MLASSINTSSKLKYNHNMGDLNIPGLPNSITAIGTFSRAASTASITIDTAAQTNTRPTSSIQSSSATSGPTSSGLDTNGKIGIGVGIGIGIPLIVILSVIAILLYRSSRRENSGISHGILHPRQHASTRFRPPAYSQVARAESIRTISKAELGESEPPVPAMRELPDTGVRREPAEIDSTR